MSELKPLEERIKNLTIGLLGMADGETIQVNKSFLEHVRADMVELSKLRRAQPANDPLTLKQPEIVRCEDCTFWTPKPGTWKSWGACSKVAERYTEDSESSMDCDTNYNDFCSCGERKDGDSNDE